MKIVCICGSTRFRKEMVEANRLETMAGNIVIAPGVFGHDGDPLTDEDKEKLDELHFKKIDMSDEILVVNPNGYIGESTRREIVYAVAQNKSIRYTAGSCGYQGKHFGASYPDAICIAGYLWDADSGDGELLSVGGDIPCPECNKEEFEKYSEED